MTCSSFSVVQCRTWRMAVEGQNPGIAAGWQKAVHWCSGTIRFLCFLCFLWFLCGTIFRCHQMSSGSFFVSCQISGSCLCTMRLRAHRLQQCNKCKCCSMFAQNFRPRGRKNAQGKRIALPVDLPFRHVRFPSLGVANHNGMHHPIQAIYRCE